MMYGEGISREGDLIDLAVNDNIVEKSGSWFSYKGERIGQGRENAKQFLKDNKDIMAQDRSRGAQGAGPAIGGGESAGGGRANAESAPHAHAQGPGRAGK